jgi:hypothetical protein
VLSSKDFGFGESPDCTPAALEMIAAAVEQPGTKIHIERGTYHFYPQKAYEKYCYITNHDDGLRSTPFPIIGMSNLEIDADSAEFIFHGLMLPVIIENSENIRLSGFSIDWELPLHSEVEVVAVDKAANTFDVRINPDTPYELRNGEVIFLKEGYEHNFERAQIWDPATMAVAYNSGRVVQLTLTEPSTVRNLDAINELYEHDRLTKEYRWRGQTNIQMAEELEPGLVRISGHRRTLPEKGHIIVAKGRNAYNRLAPAIRVHGSRDILINNVTVHHAGGMGLVAERTENITLDHFNVALKPGSGRMLTTTADATHFNNCRGLVRISDCLFENMLDDGTNIHGVYAILEDILGSSTIGMRIGHFQQMGFEFATPGDRIGFIKRGVSYFPTAEAEVKSLKKVNKRYYIIEFKEDLDPELEEGDLLDNLDWYPEVEIVNNVVRNNRARGFLLSSPRKILVEGNYFSSMMRSIGMGAGFGGSWYESGFAQEVVIRGNIFADGCYAGSGRSSLISFSAGRSEDPIVFKKIVIEDNEFRNFDPFLISGANTDTLIIRQNTISKSGTYPPLNPDNPVIRISTVNYTDFTGNVFNDYSEKDIIVDDYSMKNFHQNNNRWESK